MSELTRSSRSTLRDRFEDARRGPVLRNAVSLFGSTAVTSGLGFAFWALAARAYPLEAVGIASAAISAMQLIATVGILGLGTLIIGEVAASRSASALISTASLVATACSVVLAAGYVLTAPLLSEHLGALGAGVVGPATFVAGVALTAFTLVLDQACIGLHRGGLQFWRNTVFSAVKLALLPLGLLLDPGLGALAVYGVWLLGNVVSLVTFLGHARRGGLRPRLRPEWTLLRALRGTALTHHWLNLASQAPRLALPVMVAGVLSPELNAAFYAALLIVGFATIVPAHFATALFALSKGDDEVLAVEAHQTLRLSAAVSGASAAFFALTAGPILSLLGDGYGVATASMVILGLTTMPFAIKVHYAAVCRVQGKLVRCAWVMTAGGIVEITFSYVGARLGGLAGVGTGWLLALVLESLVLWPAVARAARMSLLPWTPVPRGKA